MKLLLNHMTDVKYLRHVNVGMVGQCLTVTSPSSTHVLLKSPYHGELIGKMRCPPKFWCPTQVWARFGQQQFYHLGFVFPKSERVKRRSFHLAGALLCGVCMSSPCLCGFTPMRRVSVHNFKNTQVIVKCMDFNKKGAPQVAFHCLQCQHSLSNSLNKWDIKLFQ